MQSLLNQISDYFSAGGPLMAPIGLLSFVMWTLIINRVLFLSGLFYKNMPRIRAARYVKKNIMPGKTYKGINALLVREFLLNRSGDKELDGYILDETVIALISSMDRHLSTIQVLSGIAPLLGLLGTVTGMMTTFDMITLFGTGNVKAMASGISEALITTQTGLFVSIPGFFMSGCLLKRASNLKYRITTTGMYLRRYL